LTQAFKEVQRMKSGGARKAPQLTTSLPPAVHADPVPPVAAVVHASPEGA
jgi:hypothetical protein